MGYIFIIRSRIWAGSIINLVYRPQNLHRMQRQKEVFDVEKEAYEKIKNEIQEETE